ncbi:MAG: alpha/beta hydrolase [Mucilaginibacter sp.]|nr:alpha/beta hydrolase [Mucilaginibacter sp.]
MVAAGARSVKNSRIRICKKDHLFSTILNEKRKIWVYLPKCENDQDDAKQQYPVVYLLDAEGHFRSFTDTIQQVDKLNGNKLFPDMIVIGIPNTKRSRDLTPTHSIYDVKGKKEPIFKLSGGGEKFISFIEKELMPHVDSTYPTTANRILVGHSLGGLIVIYTLINHTDLFNGYVASDPSMWWDSKKTLNSAREVLKQQRFNGRSLFLGIANTMPAGMNIAQVRSDTSAKTKHMRSVLELADVLESEPDNGLNFRYKYYNGDNHNSVPKITGCDGLQFLLGMVD